VLSFHLSLLSSWDYWYIPPCLALCSCSPIFVFLSGCLCVYDVLIIYGILSTILLKMYQPKTLFKGTTGWLEVLLTLQPLLLSIPSQTEPGHYFATIRASLLWQEHQGKIFFELGVGRFPCHGSLLLT
jgi:hypothetical protein